MREISLILFGIGRVGRSLLRRVLDSRSIVERRSHLCLKIVGLVERQGMLVNPGGFSDEYLQNVLKFLEKGAFSDLPAVQSKVDNMTALETTMDLLSSTPIVVDTSTSEKMSPVLIRALDLGCLVTMSNKRVLAGPWATCRRLFEDRRVRFDAAVGGGLPMIDILLGLLDTGDSISSLEGSLSGTIGYICSQLQLNVPFSKALSEARELGYTEHDPREDLSGVDTARKILILGRLAGWPLEMHDVQIEGLYSPELVDLPLEEFERAILKLDDVLAQRVKVARDEGCVLRYVGEVNQGSGVVGLRPAPRASQMGVLQGPECLLTYFTSRYTVSPLILAGRGVGADLAGAGLLGDTLKLAVCL